MRRLIAPALLLLAAACATGGRPHTADDSPSVVGNYLLTHVDNRSLPTYSPTEPNVTLLAGSLVLGNGGAFGLTLVARNSPQALPAERSIRGSYTTEGDSVITVTPTAGADAPMSYRAR